MTILFFFGGSGTGAVSVGAACAGSSLVCESVLSRSSTDIWSIFSSDLLGLWTGATGAGALLTGAPGSVPILRLFSISSRSFLIAMIPSWICFGRSSAENVGAYIIGTYLI